MTRHVARFVGVLLLAGLTTHDSTFAQSSATYNIALSHADASEDASGRIVLTMMAQGDLQGAFTIKLNRSADGSVTGGEWAFSVSYTQTLPGAPDPETGEEDPGEALVQLGVLKGSVLGGALTMNENGGVSTLTGVQLEVTGGTLTYATVTSGGGWVNGANIVNRDESTGSFSLVF